MLYFLLFLIGVFTGIMISTIIAACVLQDYEIHRSNYDHVYDL